MARKRINLKGWTWNGKPVNATMVNNTIIIKSPKEKVIKMTVL